MKNIRGIGRSRKLNCKKGEVNPLVKDSDLSFIGEIGSIPRERMDYEEMMFIRKFRFTVESKLNSQISFYVKNFKYDEEKNTINLGLYEVYTDNMEDTFPELYIKSLTSDEEIIYDELTLTTLDGKGEPINRKTFRDVVLASTAMVFNYNERDIAVQQLKLGYRILHRENLRKKS